MVGFLFKLEKDFAKTNRVDIKDEIVSVVFLLLSLWEKSLLFSVTFPHV